MIRIAVCDDDVTFLSATMKFLLSAAVKKTNIYAEIKMFSDGNLLLKEFENHNIYDIVILDIDMPSVNGKELAGKLRVIDSFFCLAFMSSYKEEVFSTIPYGINAFIPKDYDSNSCLEALIRLLEDYIAKQPKYEIFDVVKHGTYSTVKIPLDSIYYFEYSNKNILLHKSDEVLLLAGKVLDKAINPYLTQGFCKIHRNCVVNISKVYEVFDTYVILTNGEKLPVSRRQRKEILKAMCSFVSMRS